MLPDFNLDGFFLPANVSNEEIVKYHQKSNSKYLKDKTSLDAKKQSDYDNENPVKIDMYQETDFSMLPSVTEWIEANCYDIRTVDPTKLDFWKGRKIKLTDRQKKILNHIFKPDKNGISKYRTVIWSEPKKSGKTMIASCIVSYFSENIDPPNNILIIANKKDQAEGRIYRSTKPTLKALGGNVPVAVNAKPVISMPNGTTIRALPNSPTTEAGDAYCLTAWSEIWGFKTEEDERLYAELMPVETIRVSMRWIETYAGYTDESTTLLRLFKKGFKDTSERELAEGARFVPELLDITTDNRPACVEVPKEGLFIYWSHERLMPWQTPEEKERAASDLTRTEAIRLLENRWQHSISELLEPSWIDRSFADAEVEKYKHRRFVLAVDAAQRHDNIALVGTVYLEDVHYTTFLEIHDPEGQDADLEELIEVKIKELYDDGRLLTYWDDTLERFVTPVYFDPHQLHTIRLNLIEYGIDVREFNQGAERTKADTMFFHAYKKNKVRNPDNPLLREHLEGCKGKHLEGEQVRIVKGTTKDAKKVDGAVAQSMSIYASFLLKKYMLTEDDEQSILIQGSTETGWFD